MVELTQAQIDVARDLGRQALVDEPRAVAARFDRKRRKIVVDLSNGCVFAFPPDLAQGLSGAGDDELSAVELLGLGSGLRWDSLDVDLHVPSLLAGLFGTRAWLASQGGAAKSALKAATARANGAKGGRPRKSPAAS